MATCTAKVATASTSNAATYASGAFTPSVSDLLVVFVLVSGDGAGLGTLSGSTDTTAFTKIGTALKNSSADTLYVFVANALAANTTSRTVTFATNNGNATGAIVTVYSVAGMTRVGSAAVRQWKNQDAGGAAATPAPAFASTTLTINPILGCVGNGTNAATMTAPTGWTEDTSPATDVGYNTPPNGLESVRRDSGFVGTTVTWGSTSASVFAALIVELDSTSAMASTISAAGALTTPVMLGAGAITATPAGVGAVDASTALTGAASFASTTIAASATVTANGLLAVAISSTIAASASVSSATLLGAGAFSSTIAAVSSETSTLTGAGVLSGTIASTSATSSTLKGAASAGATIASVSSASSTLFGTAALTTTLPAVAAVTATLTQAGQWLATISASASLSASLLGSASCSTSIAASATVSATRTAFIAASSTISSVALLTSTGSLAAALRSTIAGVSSASLLATILAQMTSTIVARSRLFQITYFAPTTLSASARVKANGRMYKVLDIVQSVVQRTAFWHRSGR